jgi:hypothetical protein
LNVKHDGPLSDFAFNSNSRRYTKDAVKTGIDARAYRTILTHFSQR